MFIAPFTQDVSKYKLVNIETLSSTLDYEANLSIDFFTIAMGPEQNHFLLTSKEVSNPLFIFLEPAYWQIRFFLDVYTIK